MKAPTPEPDSTERELGLDAPITRRDCLNSTALEALLAAPDA